MRSESSRATQLRDSAGIDPTASPTSAIRVDELGHARARAGRSLRELGHALIGRHATLDQIERLADALDEITAELWPQAHRSRADHPFATRITDAYPQGRFDHGYDDRPVSGRASPWGLDLEMHRFDDEIEAHVTFGPAHEGAPGRAHGGVVAALFDDVFGFVLGVVREPAFTGQLSIRYEAPVPIGDPLACRVRLDRRDGRKLHMTGELRVVESGQQLTSATALFITVDVPWLSETSNTAARPAPPDEHDTTH